MSRLDNLRDAKALSEALRDVPLQPKPPLSAALKTQFALLELAVGIDPFPEAGLTHGRQRVGVTHGSVQDRLIEFALDLRTTRDRRFKRAKRQALDFLADQVRAQLSRCDYASPSHSMMTKRYGTTVARRFFRDCVLRVKTGYALPDRTPERSKVNCYAVAVFVYAAMLLEDEPARTRLLRLTDQHFGDLAPYLQWRARRKLETPK